MNSITDEMIMLEIKNGEKEYFNIILDRYYKIILNYAYRVLGKKEDAEEVLQEIFLRLYFFVRNYKPVSRPKSTSAFRYERYCCAKLRACFTI